MDWRKIKKIDAHVHLLPPERLQLWKAHPDDNWSHADPEEYFALMEQYCVEAALLLPVNDGRLYCSDPSDTNRWLGNMQKQYPGKVYGFADILSDGAYFFEETPDILEEAITEFGLKGLKIHPSNLNMDADALELVPVLRKAAERQVPVIYHSNPCRIGFHDNCAPDKINHMIQIFPDVTIITAHMGGTKWADALTGCGYVDISYILPKLVALYGIEQTNRILRSFGADRLLFGTDYPDAYGTAPEQIYETYCHLLNQMDFTEEEAQKIAYGNIAGILKIAP